MKIKSNMSNFLELPKTPTKISKLLNLYSKSKLFTKPVNISYAVIMGLLNLGN